MTQDMRQDVGTGLMGVLVLLVGLLVSAAGNEWLSLVGQLAALIGGALILLSLFLVARALIGGR